VEGLLALGLEEQVEELEEELVGLVELVGIKVGIIGSTLAPLSRML
jgi:hypothetical protein